MASDSRILPWHDATWETLSRQYRRDRAPHALLLCGPAGSGKRVFAERLAAWLLCERRAEVDDACGRCSACTKFEASTHPDLHLCTLEADKQSIPIDAVRALAADLQLSSHERGWKVAIIDPADRMNAHSYNAMLKTLEEPPGQALLLLVSARPARLPATVRSRCQRVSFPTPDRDLASGWIRERGVQDAERSLALTGGAPLAALALAESGFLAKRRELVDSLVDLTNGRTDVVTAVSAWKDLPFDFSVSWLQTVVHDLVRVKHAAGADRLANPDLGEGLQRLSQQLDLPGLFNYLDVLLRAQAVVNTAVNPQLQLEGLLVPWLDGLDKAA